MILKMVLTGCAVAALALAQGGMDGGAGGGAGGGGGSIGGAGRETGGGGGGMGMGRVQKQTKAEMMADRLKMNKEQKEEFQTILTAAEKDSLDVVKAVQNSRNMYATALVNGKSEADMATLTKALEDAQFQMLGVEVRTFQKVVETLKPNQLAKAPEAFDLMADIFVPTGPAGGGRGMGGGMGRQGGGGGR